MKYRCSAGCAAAKSTSPRATICSSSWSTIRWMIHGSCSPDEGPRNVVKSSSRLMRRSRSSATYALERGRDREELLDRIDDRRAAVRLLCDRGEVRRRDLPSEDRRDRG